MPAVAPAAASAPSPSEEPAGSAAAAAVEGEESKEDEDDKPKGLLPNAQRGAVYSHYSWGQSLSEVSVWVPVPRGIKAKSLDVLIRRDRLRVAVKGEAAAIIDGELAEPVKPEDCLWNLSDGTVELTLTKAEGMHWWKAVIKVRDVT